MAYPQGLLLGGLHGDNLHFKDISHCILQQHNNYTSQGPHSYLWESLIYSASKITVPVLLKTGIRAQTI